MASQAATQNVTNRWLIAAAGVVMQVALGAVYAWSVFRIPLSNAYGSSVSAVNTTFSIAILALGFAAFFGGLWMNRSGPRIVALSAGALYGAGIFLASFAEPSLWILYLTYGVMAGIGIGLGYIVPIATLIKWFPDKRGVITGIAVAGYGAGAVITAPIAKRLIASVGVFETFAILGVIYAIAVIGAAMFIKNPPEGYKPEGWEPDTSERSDRSGREFEFGEALKTWQWFALWALLFLNVTAGIAVVSGAPPLTEESAGGGAPPAAGPPSLVAL